MHVSLTTYLYIYIYTCTQVHKTMHVCFFLHSDVEALSKSEPNSQPSTPRVTSMTPGWGICSFVAGKWWQRATADCSGAASSVQASLMLPIEQSWFESLLV